MQEKIKFLTVRRFSTFFLLWKVEVEIRFPASAAHCLHVCTCPPRWSGPPGPGFRLHLRDGVPHQSRERVPQPAARGPQRAARAEKHAAGDKVSLMERLIRSCTMAVFIQKRDTGDDIDDKLLSKLWEIQIIRAHIHVQYWDVHESKVLGGKKRINKQQHSLIKVRSVIRYFHFRVKLQICQSSNTVMAQNLLIWPGLLPEHRLRRFFCCLCEIHKCYIYRVKFSANRHIPYVLNYCKIKLSHFPRASMCPLFEDPWGYEPLLSSQLFSVLHTVALTFVKGEWDFLNERNQALDGSNL